MEGKNQFGVYDTLFSELLTYHSFQTTQTGFLKPAFSGAQPEIFQCRVGFLE